MTGSRPRVLVRETISEAGVGLLEASGLEVVADRDAPLAEALADVEALIVRSATKVTAEVLNGAGRLRVIGRAGVGVDNVDVEAATRHGIIVANAPESNIVSAAEHTIGLLLALARNIPQAHAALVDGRWERSRFGGVELAGKTLGLLGLGRIGSEVARRAQGLQMKTIAHDPYITPQRLLELGVEAASLAELLERSDFITLHLPLNESTRGLINREAIARMRAGVRLINAARGALIDDQALVGALESGRVAGAAIDVFREEPYSGPLLQAPNVVVTPHLAASTEEAQDRAGVVVAEQVVAALQGELVTNAVNIPAIGADDLQALAAFLPLARRLGRLAGGLAGGRARQVRVETSGAIAAFDTRLLALAVLNGVLRANGSDGTINYVNAPLLAAERGIELVEEKRQTVRDFTSLVAVIVDDVRVVGTILGASGRHWLVEALGFELEIELAPRMVFLRYDDIPGVIGKVGTLFGDADVNIANMAVSRTRAGGQVLMGLSLDEASPAGVLPALQQVGDVVLLLGDAVPPTAEVDSRLHLYAPVAVDA